MSDDMTLPPEAVEAALNVVMDDGHNGIECRPDRNLGTTVRAALEAALPHLRPEPEFEAPMCEEIGCVLRLDHARVHIDEDGNAWPTEEDAETKALAEVGTKERVAEVVAEALRDHYPTRGMAVSMGVTCECQYWTGNEPSGLLGAGMGGRDQLNRHRASLATDALFAAGVFHDEAEDAREARWAQMYSDAVDNGNELAQELRQDRLPEEGSV